MWDVIIIGGGVVGCSIARELSKTKRSVALLEAGSDICEGTSKANSGIAHAGYDAMPGSLMAKLNVRGNELLGSLSKELDFPFKRDGSLVLCFEEEGLPKLQELYDRGVKNGVPDMEIISGDEARRLEPALSKEVKGALYAKSAGIVCPFGLTIAMAENAAANGVEFYLDSKVTAISQIEGGYVVSCENGKTYEAAIVINAAGVCADLIHNMLPEAPGHEKMEIIPRKGEYLLYDKQVGTTVGRTIFQLPGKYGKGILATPTVHGNFLLGPTATDIPDKEGVETTAEGLAQVLEKGAKSLEALPSSRLVITSFAGLRAHHENHEFIIEESGAYKGFIDVAGIESPGLTSAPAIGEYVANMVMEMAPVALKDDFVATRKAIPNPLEMTLEERKVFLAKNPTFANIICRCESISEGEILEAIHRPVGATTLDGVKRRTRAGMGRCQGGFCSPKVTAILARELEVAPEQIRKSGPRSVILYGDTK